MSTTKYVVGLARAGYVERVVAIIFPEDVVHRDMALKFFGDEHRILGAGFCDLRLRDDQRPAMFVYGESVSLDVKSRPEDAHYLDYAMSLIEHVPGDVRIADEDKVWENINKAFPQPATPKSHVGLGDDRKYETKCHE